MKNKIDKMDAYSHNMNATLWNTFNSIMGSLRTGKWLWRDLFLNYKESERWIPRELCGGVRKDGSKKYCKPLKDYLK